MNSIIAKIESALARLPPSIRNERPDRNRQAARAEHKSRADLIGSSPMARENRIWGYDHIAGALRNLGYSLSEQTVGNILGRSGIALLPNVANK